MRRCLRAAFLALRRLLWRGGYDVVRLPPHDPRLARAAYDASRPLPPAAAELRPDHPRLEDLRRRYAAAALPMAQRTMWGGDYLARELDLRHFRGDNAYLWQLRHTRGDERTKYYVYLRDLATRDPHRLLGRLGEDGAFGCWTFEYPGWPAVSRDLLDSLSEIYFLDRHLGLLDAPGFSVLDVGAGYGRLAHRLTAAAPALGTYWCTDAVPESTFLCEFYLRFRSVGERARVVPLDELAVLDGRRIDLAVNIHSFSEMSSAAIAGWLDLLRRLAVPNLLIVPNDADRLLTLEADGRRLDFMPLLAERGYRLRTSEPTFADPTLRQVLSARDYFLLFQRA